MTKTINDLIKGESARIFQFIDKPSALRLLSLGVLPNAMVTLVRRSPFSDALYLRVGEQYIAIRNSEAKNIIIYT